MRVGIECKISLAKKLPITLGGAITLSFDLGSFTNASPRYILTNGVITGPFAGGTLATRVIGDKQFAQFEAATSTINSYSEALQTIFTTLYNTSWSANTGTDPIGLNTADKLCETAVDDWHFAGHAVNVTNGQYYCIGVFAKADERIEFDLNNNFGAAVTVVAYNLSTVTATLESGAPIAYGIIPLCSSNFFCYTIQQAVATAAKNVYIELRAGGLNSYPGVLGYGIYYSFYNIVEKPLLSSYISADGTPTTKNKDQYHWAAADIPAWLRNGFKARLIMHQATDEMLAADGGEKVLFAVDTSGAKGVVELYFDGADKKLKWRDDDTGALGESAALNWSIDDVIDIEWNPDNGSNSTLKVVGGGVDTTYNGTQTAIADGDLYYGMDDSEAKQLDIALISEPEPL